ncbi:MAG: aminoglycoside phosphotransferase family protein [Bacteroidota bacterium]|nr:aminoglycoside phosphotransferase family protein [Bacteroidota bacterium]
MTKEIFSAYNLVQDELEIEPINNGLINETWHIKNSHADYILQKINHSIFKDPDAIAFNVRMIADYLSETNPDYLFIGPIKTIANEEMKYISGKGYFRLMPFVKKSHTINAALMPEHAFEAAKAFGKFTRLLAGFPAEKLKITLPDFHNLTLRYQQFHEALQSGNTKRLQQSKKLIQTLEDHKNIVETYQNVLQTPSFKLRVTHHDTKISNVLFDIENKGLCIIDLDTVMPGYFISDVGDMMRTYLSPANEEEKDFSKIEIREEYFKAIWDGYMGEMDTELTIEEKKHFIYAGKFMIYMQAIRFLTDHLNNDIYYSTKYEDQNLVRAGNQLVLLKCLIDKEITLQELVK